MHKSHVLTTRVELSWEASPGYLDSYLVMLKNCAGDVVAKKSTESTRPTVLLDNPRTETVYEVVIWSVADGKISDPTTSKIQVEESNLRIRNLVVKDRGTTFVDLGWTRPVYSLVESYEVRLYSVQSKPVQTFKVNPDVTVLHMKILTPGQLFTFAFTSVLPTQCGEKERVQSEDISVRTMPSPPGPLNMHKSHVLTTRVELSWEASPGYLDSYLVMLKNCEGDIVAETSTESTLPTVLLDNPRTGAAYEVVLWAVADGTMSHPTTAIIRMKGSNVRNLVVKEMGTTFVMLEWTHPVYIIVESVEVRWYPVHSKSVQIRKFDPDETSLYIEDLTPGQLFKFDFTSVLLNQCGEEERVQSTDLLVRTMPSPPGQINMHKSHVLTTRVELSWEASPGYLDSYLVMLKNCAGDVVTKKSTESTRPSVVLDNPQTGTAYEVVIWAVADETISDPTTSKIQVEESNLRVRNLIVKERGTTFVMLEWTHPVYGSVESYEVRWYPVYSKSVQTRKVDPDQTSLHVEELTPGQLFKFIVTSVLPSHCGDEERVLSEDISVRTLEERPEPPFIDEKRSSTKSTSIELMTIKPLKDIWKHIIVRKPNDKSEVARFSSRKDTMLVDEEIDINTDYQIEIYVKTGGIQSKSQFVNMKTKDIRVSMPCLIGAIVGGTIAIGSLGTIGPMLAALGFGSGGITSGTIAAWLMSFGNVSAGSLFAILQSVGVVGLSVAAKATFIAVGLSAGCMVEVV
ncbi:receptor-type tyrosine-protein phosphatase beta-like [Mizuhopecten yessoensis]|uniref:receptor-type tyrosine-protein phosphatase beta-like n=1 Tax=Mizuhopecten yessoensis TaxID=6573 RepID=UPI000B45C75A|nr:receptor-type tyrosine-protein phosphatase beta-like [Mizuhopecten yessoensis]